MNPPRNRFALDQKGLCNNHAKDDEAATYTMDDYWNSGEPFNELSGAGV